MLGLMTTTSPRETNLPMPPSSAMAFLTSAFTSSPLTTTRSGAAASAAKTGILEVATAAAPLASNPISRKNSRRVRSILLPIVPTPFLRTFSAADRRESLLEDDQ